MFVVATNSGGDSAGSEGVNPSIPLEKPTIVENFASPSINEFNTSDGFIDLIWDEVPGADGYDYESFDVGNINSWSTLDQGIWPTYLEINHGRYRLHHDGLGADLPVSPRQTYTNGYNAGGQYGDFRNYESYWINVSAYVGGKNSGSSGVTPSIFQHSEILENELNDLFSTNIEASNKQYNIYNSEEFKTILNNKEYNEIVSSIDVSNVSIAGSNMQLDENGEGFIEFSDEEFGVILAKNGYEDISGELKFSNGKNKIKFNKWGVEIWLSKTAVQTLGAIGYAGFAWMIGILFPGFGSLVAGVLAPIYHNVILKKANAIYVKKWYTGKRIVYKQ